MVYSGSDAAENPGKASWRALWIALRRARTDKRARHALLLFAGGLAAISLYPLYLWFTYRQVGIQGFFYLYVPIMLVALAAGCVMRRSHRRSDEMIAFSITGREPSGSGIWKPSPEVVKYMGVRAKILSAMILRGTGEICIRSGVQPKGTEPRARQSGNMLLRSAGQWDELTAQERDLMSSPEGAWTIEQAEHVVAWREQLRLLRWSLGMDSVLEPIDHLVPHDAELHGGLWEPDASRFSDAPIRIPSDARAVHDLAQGYYTRALAEMTSRQLVNLPVDTTAILEKFRQSVLGDSSDFLAGERTVAELRNEELPILAMIAHARVEYAGYLAELLSAVAPFAFRSSSESARTPDSDR
jgi:hypothetical protein